MLEVSEIFGPTIQGEGKFVGTPSIFIRFARCNFTCQGFKVEYETSSSKKYGCDTYYSVDKEYKNNWTKYSNYLDIVKQVDLLSLKLNYKIDIVISGGEPLLYWKNDEFQKLLKYYIQNGNKITIETNSSIDIDFEFDYQKKILFSMSVKLSNSLEDENKRIKKNVITKILKNSQDSYLKFVINPSCKDALTNEIINILQDIPKCEVYLMPLGSTQEEINNNSKDLINMAIQNGFKYCDRLHIRLWNNKQGV